VGHEGEDPRESDREPECTRPEASGDEVRGRHEPVPMGDRPEPGHEHEYDRLDENRVRDREPAGHGAERVHRARHSDKRVGRIEVSAEQEPGDEAAEGPAAEAPLVKRRELADTAPPRRCESKDRDEREQDGCYRERDAVELHATLPRLRRRRGPATSNWYASNWQPEFSSSQRSEYQ